jgi:hypothetical protein
MMKVSLSGLLANVSAALNSRERKYYAFCLEELHDHIVGLVNGEHTLEEFAEHYCIKRRASITEG